MSFQKATKKGTFARVALLGPAGSGKTYTALRLAHGLAEGKPIAVFDTERGSASKYAGDPNPDGGVFDFLVMDDMPDFAPKRYIQAIQDAERAGVGVLIFDSLSHAWSGPGGILEFVDNKKSGGNNNQFSAWRDATPLHNQLVDALLNARCHLIVTMRTKMEYVLEDDGKGRKVPRKVGLQPVQRDGVEYEFDVIMDLAESGAIVSKSRCSELAGKRFHEPGAGVAKLLQVWLQGGEVAPPRRVAAPVEEAARTSEPEQQAPKANGQAAADPKVAKASEATLAALIDTFLQRVVTWPGYELAETSHVKQALEKVLKTDLASLTEARAQELARTFGARTDAQLMERFSSPLAEVGVVPF